MKPTVKSGWANIRLIQSYSEGSVKKRCSIAIALEYAINKVQVSQEEINLNSIFLSENIKIKIHGTVILPFSLKGRNIG
jgi:hypothetical protein